MDDRSIQFRLGVFVVIVTTIVVTVVLMILFGEAPIGRQKTVFIRFEATPGVTRETPIRKSGILVGRVKNVELKPYGVLVTASIGNEHEIMTSDVCRITTDNLFGDAVLEFVKGEVVGQTPRPLREGDFLSGMVANNPLDVLQVVVNLEEDMVRALASIQTAGEQVGQVAENLNVLVTNNQDQFNRILGQTEKALGRFETAMVSVNQIVSDEDLTVALQEALEDVPRLLNDAAALLQGLNRVAAEAETNLANLRGLTEPLGDQGGQIVKKLDTSASRLDELLQQLVTFSQSLNDSEGSLGQFVNNPDLYQRLNRAAANIEHVTDRLEPIVNDARVAIDKVARNPRMLGVQGALQRRTSGIK